MNSLTRSGEKMNKEREHERDCMNPRDKNKERREEIGRKKRLRQKRRDEKIERLGESEAKPMNEQ